MMSRVSATYEFTHDYRQTARAPFPRFVGTLTVKLAVDRPLTFGATNDLAGKA